MKHRSIYTGHWYSKELKPHKKQQTKTLLKNKERQYIMHWDMFKRLKTKS